jgi:hypothetical protein
LLDLWIYGSRFESPRRFSLCHQEGKQPSDLGSFSETFFQRQEEERFKKIDAKRGGRGFV